MKNKLQKYLPLYVGCKGVVRINFDKNSWTDRKFGSYTLMGVDTRDDLQVLLKAESSGVSMWYNWRDDFAFCLRPLSDMTHDESNMNLPMLPSQSERSAYATRKLLALGFDLFQLIDSKVAVDITTLEKE